VDLGAIRVENLPEEMQKMSVEERAGCVGKKAAGGKASDAGNREARTGIPLRGDGEPHIPSRRIGLLLAVAFLALFATPPAGAQCASGNRLIDEFAEAVERTERSHSGECPACAASAQSLRKCPAFSERIAALRSEWEVRNSAHLRACPTCNADPKWRRRADPWIELLTLKAENADAGSPVGAWARGKLDALWVALPLAAGGLAFFFGMIAFQRWAVRLGTCLYECTGVGEALAHRADLRRGLARLVLATAAVFLCSIAVFVVFGIFALSNLDEGSSWFDPAHVTSRYSIALIVIASAGAGITAHGLAQPARIAYRIARVLFLLRPARRPGSRGSAPSWRRLGTVRHPERIVGVAVDSSGTLAASASADGTVKVWKTESGEEVRATGPIGPLLCLALSRTGGWLACGAEDGGVRVWDLVWSRNSSATRLGFPSPVAQREVTTERGEGRFESSMADRTTRHGTGSCPLPPKG